MTRQSSAERSSEAFCELVEVKDENEVSLFFAGISDFKHRFVSTISNLMQAELAACGFPHLLPQFGPGKSFTSHHEATLILPPRLRVEFQGKFEHYMHAWVTLDNSEIVLAVGMGKNKKIQDRACRLSLALALAEKRGRLADFLYDNDLSFKTSFPDKPLEPQAGFCGVDVLNAGTLQNRSGKSTAPATSSWIANTSNTRGHIEWDPKKHRNMVTAETDMSQMKKLPNEDLHRILGGL